jgi:hypothetical protein
MQGEELRPRDGDPRGLQGLAKREGDGLDPRAQPAERLHRLVERGLHRAVQLGPVEVRAHREPHAFHPRLDALGEVRHGDVLTRRIVGVPARHALKQQPGVPRGPRDGTGMVEAEGIGIDPAQTHAAVGGLEAHHAAARGGAANGAPGVGPGGGGAEERGDGGARPATRATRRVVEVPRVARRAVPGIVRGGARGELVGIAFADDDRPRPLEASHGFGVRRGHVVAVEGRAVGRADPGGVEDVLHPDGDPVQRPQPRTAGDRSLRLARGGARGVGAHRDVGAESRVQALDPHQVRLGQLHGGDFPGADQPRLLAQPEKRQPLVAHLAFSSLPCASERGAFHVPPASFGASAGAPSMGRPAAFQELKPVS